MKLKEQICTYDDLKCAYYNLEQNGMLHFKVPYVKI